MMRDDEMRLASEGEACARRAERAGSLDDAGIGCVVMASGVGRRFGSQKLVAPLAGVPVLERTLGALAGDSLDTVVVTRSVEVESLCAHMGVRCIVHDGALQSDTVRRGLEVVQHRPACMFVPGDQALLSRESVERLVEEARSHPECIVRLSWRGNPASPIVFPASLYGKLAAIEGDCGGSAVLKDYPELQATVRCVEALHEWELFDVDTPEDLARLERIVK